MNNEDTYKKHNNNNNMRMRITNENIRMFYDAHTPTITNHMMMITNKVGGIYFFYNEKKITNS